jgi:hypothetical protein
MDVLLRDVLKRMLQERKITQLELVGRLQGKIKQGNLSAALNGKRQFTLAMLDLITDALELEKGALYLYFEQECFDKRGNLRPQKTKEFILSCYETGLGHVTRRLVNHLIEQGSENGKILFSIAERLFELNLFLEALSFYNSVIDMELATRTESDRLPISCYRKFVILDQMQSDSTHDAFVLLTGYLKNMPHKSERTLPGDSGNLQFDAYQKAIGYCMEREIWHRVMTLSEQLGKLAIAEQDRQAYGLSLLYKGEAAMSLKNFTLVSQLLDQCARISSSSLQREVEAFRLRLELEKGELSRFGDCLLWLSRNPDQLAKLLPPLFKACLKQNRLQEAAQVLEQCGEGLSALQANSARYIWKKWHAKMDRLLAEYWLRTGSFDQASEKLLSAIQGAAFLSLTSDVIDCMLLYEEFRDQVPKETRERFLEILRLAMTNR